MQWLVLPRVLLNHTLFSITLLTIRQLFCLENIKVYQKYQKSKLTQQK